MLSVFALPSDLLIRPPTHLNWVSAYNELGTALPLVSYVVVGISRQGRIRALQRGDLGRYFLLLRQQSVARVAEVA